MLSAKKLKRKLCGLVLSLAMLFSMPVPGWAAEAAASGGSAGELSGHWAERQMRQWIDHGLLAGDGGKYYPDRAITRAELVTLINKAFDFREKAEIAFSDITGHWAHDQMAAAVKAGYIRGYEDNTVRPDQRVTREEAAVMIAGVLHLEGGSEEDLSVFTDEGSISGWSRPSVAALAAQRLIRGTPDGAFLPRNSLTRAEAVTILDNALATFSSAVVYSRPGVYGPATGTETVSRNVVVAAPGVTLRNMHIKGDLTVAEDVGEGDVTLRNVKVDGTTTIRGGGENSVHLEDSVLVRIVVSKEFGTVRVVAVGETSVATVIVNTPVKLEEADLSEGGFVFVELTDRLPQGSQVELIGQFERVSVLAAEIRVSIPAGAVGMLDVGAAAENAAIELGTEATIAELVLNAVTEVLGQGSVQKATVNDGAAGSKFGKAPNQVGGNAADTVTVTTGGGGGVPVIGGGGGGGGNSGGGNPGGSPGNDPADTSEEEDSFDPIYPVPFPPCTGTQEECSEATLANLEIQGYTLEQAIPYTEVVNTGILQFSPSVTSYIAVRNTPLQSPEKVTVTVTKSVYSWVTYQLADHTRTLYLSKALKDSDTFEVTVQPKKDVWLLIYVISGNGHLNLYQVVLHDPRSMQEAAKISGWDMYFENAGKTEHARLHQLVVGAVKGKVVKMSDLIKIYKADRTTLVMSCPMMYCNMEQNQLTAGETWYIQVERDGQLIAEGEYTADFSPVPYLSAIDGLSVKILNKTELREVMQQNPRIVDNLIYGYEVYINDAALLAKFPNAKYVAVDRTVMDKTVTKMPEPLTKEDLKTGIHLEFIAGKYGRFQELKKISQDNKVNRVLFENYMTASSLSPENKFKKIIPDEFVHAVLYDENLNPIAQTMFVLTYDENQVADGYTPARNWSPSQN